ncbi:HAMP domain-containing protein [bacterium]|nr:HAMP domain-containing protein [bacterium]
MRRSSGAGLFGTIHQKIQLSVMLLILLLTISVTWAAVWVIRRNTFDSVSKSVRQDARALQLVHAHREHELRARTRFLAAEPKIIAALGTPDIDRPTLQHLIDELRTEVDLDLLMIVGLDPDASAASVREGPAPGRPDWLITGAGRAESGYLDAGPRVVRAVAAPVEIGGMTLGSVVIGEFIDRSYLESVRPLIASDILLCRDETGEKSRPLASTIRRLDPEMILSAVSGPARAEAQKIRLSIGPDEEDFLVESVSLDPHLTGFFLKSLADAESASWQFLRWAVLIAAAFLILAGIGVSRLAGAITRPILQLMRGTESIAEGRLDARTDIPGPDELRRLSQSFNAMAERIAHLLKSEEEARTRLEERVKDRTAELVEANQMLVQAHQQLKEQTSRMIRYEKLASVGTLAAGLAHELNNPLTVILGRAQVFADTRTNAHDRILALAMAREAKRCAEIVESMLRFASRESLRRISSDLNVTIDLALSLLKLDTQFQNIQIVKFYDERLPRTLIDETLMERVVVNVALNALQAMRDDRGSGTLTVRTGTEGGMIWMKFTDDGPGIPPEISEKVFDPFFTTKEVGKGRGLGLSVAHGIVEQHGGRIFVERSGPDGTTVAVELPVLSATALERK